MTVNTAVWSCVKKLPVVCM